MRVSIITVCYNSAETIEDTIKSVLEQDYNNIEYIVIDGGSTDGTNAIIQQYRDQISYYISEPDKGIYDAMNKGVEAATGELIGILNSDDLYFNKSVISDIIGKIGVNDGIYADLIYVDQKNINRIRRIWRSGKYSRKAFLWGWMPPHPTFFVKKKCYNKYGLYDLALKTASDYELMLRFLYKHKISIAYLPEVIIKMRTGGVSNLSIKNRIIANREDKKSWKINQLKPNIFTFLMKPLRKLGQFRLLNRNARI